MINARGNFRAVAVERFAWQTWAGADCIVAVANAAARQTNSQIRVRPQCVDETEFRIQINRRECETQREIRAQKIRLIVVEKCIGRQWRMAFKSLIIAELD